MIKANRTLLIPILFAVLRFSLSAVPSLDPTEWDTGILAANRVYSREVSVAAGEDRGVRIQIMSTCGCLSVSPGELVLAPGEKGAFLISLDTSDDRGEYEKILIVRTDDPSLPKAFFPVFGTIVEDEPEGMVPAIQPSSSAPQETVSTAPEEGPAEEGNPAAGTRGADFLYFYSPACRECRRFLGEALPALAERLGRPVVPDLRDIQEPENYEELMSLLAGRNEDFRQFPVAAAPGGFLQGDREIQEGLETLLVSAPAAGPEENRGPSGEAGADSGVSGSGPVGGSAGEPAGLFSPGGRLLLAPVILAGLLDGINPCAFTTLIFLLSALAVAGRSRREILTIGLFFTVSVYLTYFLLGLGFFRLLRLADSFEFVSILLRWILAVVLVLFALLSLVDYRRIRQGRSGEILLQLPMAMKKRIHRSVRTYVRSTALAGSSLILGFLVSVFELGCTGQIYLPTIGYVIRTGGGSRGYLALGVYNLAFILPLALVFWGSYRGLGSEKLAGLFRRHLGKVKLCTAILFLLLAGLTIIF